MTQLVRGSLPGEGASPRFEGVLRASQWLWLAAAVVVPLVVNPWGSSAFELPKAALLRALALGLFLSVMVSSIERPERRGPLGGPLLAALPLALALSLATAFSVDLRASLWGSHGRQQGLITWLAYLVLFVGTAGMLHNHQQWRRLVEVLAWGSAPVVAYGLTQALGLDPMDWTTDSASPVLSTLGRSNQLGSYVAMLIPLTAALVPHGRRRWATAVLLAAQVICLALTRARASYAGLAAALLVFGVLWLARRGRRPVQWPLTILAGLAVPLGLGGSWLLSASTSLLQWVTGMGGSIAARATICTAALPLVGARPWLGHGLETLAAVFASVFPPQLIYYQGRYLVVDRAHNFGMDLALSSGLAGLVAVSILVGWAMWTLWRAPSDRLSPEQQLLRIALTAAIVGHLLDLQFSFDLTAGATVFWLLLALAAAFPRVMAQTGKTPAPPDSLPPLRPSTVRPMLGWWERLSGMDEGVLYIPPLLATLALAALLCVRPLVADTAIWRAAQASAPQDGLALAEQAVSLMPREPSYRTTLARICLVSGLDEEAERQARTAVNLSARDPTVWMVLGTVYLQWGQTDSSRLVQAEAAYRTAVELAPNVAVYHTRLGLALAAQNRPSEAASEWERAVSLDATDYVAYGYLALVYRDLGRDEDAAWAAAQADYWEARTATDAP